MQRYEFPINIIDTFLPLFYTIKLEVVKKSKEGSISKRTFLYTLFNNIIGKKLLQSLPIPKSIAISDFNNSA